MRGGALRNVIDIQQDAGTTRDVMNARVPGWTTWRKVFCEVTVLNGKEFFDTETKERFSQVLYRFRCRFSDVDGIDAGTMRIVHETKIYDIRAVLPDDQRRTDCVIEATLQTQ